MRKSTPKLLAIFVLAVMFQSCSKKDDHDHKVTAEDIVPIQTALKAGDWTISNHIRFGNDRTSDYEAYSFSFNSDGTLAATDGSTALSGAWSVTEEKHPTNENLNHVHLNILFSSPEIFVEISDDWDIREYTANRMVLDAVLDLDGGRKLTFEK